MSEALSSLQGHRLEGATLTAVGPGAYTLSLATDEGRLSLRLDRQGARITSRGGLTVDATRYYMACLDLTGRSVLVVGAGRVALEKVEGLLAAGADVTVVAPQVVPELELLDVALVRRGYRTDDLDGRFLVVAATSTTSVNRRVFRDAEARTLLCNVVDVPELCSLHPPGGPPAGADRDRRLDGRRFARAGAAPA